LAIFKDIGMGDNAIIKILLQSDMNGILL
jgi:hypothetical protein